MNTDQINDLRRKIDEIDAHITELLLQRFDVVKDICAYKKTHGLEIFQQDREAEILQNISDKINRSEYSEYILKIYGGILMSSKQAQSTEYDTKSSRQ